MNEAETRADLLPLPLAGEGWGEGSRLLDRLKYSVAIAHHVVVPEPQHTPAVGCEEGVAPCVGRAFCMLTAIELNDEPMLDRCEVRDEWADRDLAPKFDSAQTTVAKQPPHDPLHISRVTAKRPRRVPFLTFAHALPSPGRYAATLSRKRERGSPIFHSQSYTHGEVISCSRNM